MALLPACACLRSSEPRLVAILAYAVSHPVSLTPASVARLTAGGSLPTSCAAVSHKTASGGCLSLSSTAPSIGARRAFFLTVVPDAMSDDFPPQEQSKSDEPAPRPAIRTALDCQTCFTRCSTRGGHISHRLSHLRASNAAGERRRGRAAGRPPPGPPSHFDTASSAGVEVGAGGSGDSHAGASTVLEPAAHG